MKSNLYQIENPFLVFEEHIKEEIARRTDSPEILKWTFSLLTTLALMERQTERFRDCEALKERSFTNRYWAKYMSRHGLDFSTRKSDQKNFTEQEIENFRNEMNRKIMFYTIDQMLNFDESGVFSLSSYLKINISIIDVIYSIYFLLYSFNKKFY